MVGVWELDNLGGMEESFIEAFNEAAEEMAEGDDERADIARRSQIERIFIDGEWGNGTASYGEDMMRVMVVISIQGVENEHLHPMFDIVARNITERMQGMLTEGEVEIPPELVEATTGLDIRPAPASELPRAVNLAFSTQEFTRVDVEDRTVFDLTRAEALEFREGVDFRGLPRIPLEQLRSGEEDDEEGPVTGPTDETTEGKQETPEEEEVEETRSREELLAEEFPGLPGFLRPYGHDDGRVEIPVGRKDTKQVEPREPYEFEVVQATHRPTPRGIPYDAPQAMVQEVMPGVGEAIRSGRFGHATGTQDQIAPSTFPRTSAYIRNHLKFEGPSYVLEMFNDLLVYLAFVNNIYNFSLRIGTYSSFREFIYVLKEMPERGGPELIRPLSQQQSSSRGLETIPDHPTVEGEKAPWLERRQYYVLVEDNEDHDAWRNPYEYLHEELSEG